MLQIIQKAVQKFSQSPRKMVYKNQSVSVRKNFGKIRGVFGNREISKIPETRQSVYCAFSVDIDELNAAVKAVGQTDLEIASRHRFRISPFGQRRECGWLLISKTLPAASGRMIFISSENSGI